MIILFDFEFVERDPILDSPENDGAIFWPGNEESSLEKVQKGYWARMLHKFTPLSFGAQVIQLDDFWEAA